MIPPRSRFRLQIPFWLSVCLLLTLAALSTAAQSGRRSVTPASPSVPAPTPTADVKQPDKTAESNDIKRQVIILTTNRGDVFEGAPPYFYDTVLKSCADRLEDAGGLRVDVVSKHTSRGDAINAAKAEKEAYVVWLQLRSDNLGRSGSTGDVRDIVIEFTIFDPTTAKVKTQGTSYPGAARSGGTVISPGSAGNRNEAIAESRLREAARDAAERILKALHVASPSDLPTH
jgi:hypothetical protein